MFEYLALGKIDLARTDGESSGAVAAPSSDPRGLLKQPKPLAVFTYLLLAEPRGLHRRDAIVAMFWPESDQKRSRAALSQALYVIRRALGSEVVESRGNEEIGIAPGIVRCDVLEFRQAADEDRLEDAMALYGGELLPAFFTSDAPGFERWLDRQRAQLANLAASMAWRLADRAESAGNAAACGHWGRRAAALSPYDESSVQRLMEMLARLGDRSGALRAYERFRAESKAELEIEPSASTRELADRIRASLDGPARESGDITFKSVSARTPPAGTLEAGALSEEARRPRSRRATAGLLAGIALTALVVLFGRFGGGPAAADGGPASRGGLRPALIAVMPIRPMGAADSVRAEIMTAKLTESLTRAGFTMPPYETMKALGDSAPAIRRGEDGVSWVVRGELVDTDGVSELTIRIVDPKADLQLRAQPFREGGRTTMDFMLRVAQETADTLAALMGIEPGKLTVPRLTADPIADSLYLRARYELPQNFTLPGLRRAAAQLREAIARDSGFAPAYVDLAMVLNDMARIFWDPPPDEIMPEADALLARAVELDPANPDVQVALGWQAYTWTWDWDAAERYFREALRLSPDHVLAHASFAFVLLATGRTEQGLALSRRSVELGPLSPLAGTTYCWHLYLASRFDDAVAACNRVLSDIDPTKLVANGAPRLARIFAARGEDRAAAARSIHLTNMDTDVNYEHSAAMWAAIGGDTARALELIDADKRNPMTRPFRIASAYAWAGQIDSAFVWLDRSIESRDAYLAEIAIRPAMEPLRGDPRFAVVLRRLNLPVTEVTEVAESAD